MNGVAARLANRVQLTTDGLGVYLNTVQYAVQLLVNLSNDPQHEMKIGNPVKEKPQDE